MRTAVRQFGHPQGAAGRLAGWIMAHRSSNRQRNQWVVSLLDVRPGERVLEVGFGPGVAIAELSRRATGGVVYGADHSEVMARRAARHNAAAVRAGRVRLILASSEQLSSCDFGGPLDAAMAVNTLGFWPDPTRRLADLHALLRPGGRIAIATQPRNLGAGAEDAERAAKEITDRLQEAGFTGMRVKTLRLDPPVVCVLADRP